MIAGLLVPIILSQSEPWIPVADLTVGKGAVWSVCWVGDSEKIVCGDDEGLYLVDVSARKVELTSEEGFSPVTASPNGKQIAAASKDGLTLFDPKSLKSVFEWNEQNGFTFKEIDEYLVCLAVSPDSKFVFAGTSEGDLVRFDLNSKSVKRFGAHGGKLNSISFSRDSKWMATCAEDNKGFVWELSGMSRIFETQFIEPVVSCAFSSEGQSVLFGANDGAMRLVQIPEMRVLAEERFKGSVSGVAGFGKSEWMVIGSSEEFPGMIALFDGSLKSREPVYRLSGWPWGVSSSTKTRQIAIGSDGGRVIVVKNR